MMWINWWSSGNACDKCVFCKILTHRTQGLSDSQLLNMMYGLVLTYERNLIDQTYDMMTHSDNFDSDKIWFFV